MKKGRVMVAVVLTLFLVLAVGIVSASIGNCHCYEACQYCQDGTCAINEGGYGGCFCSENPCRLSENFLCCPNGE
jgi:hypothetical protein